MAPADRAAFAALMTQALAFYRQDVTEFVLEVWWNACQPFGLDQVRKALTAHAVDPQHGQFAPKPADLVRQLVGTHGDRALMAWGKVHEAMASVGAYASVDFGDAAIQAAIVDIGGWPALARAEIAELPFWQKRFCDAYRVYAQRGAPDAPRQLAGQHALTNAALGYAPSTQAEQLALADRLALTAGSAS